MGVVAMPGCWCPHHYHHLLFLTSFLFADGQTGAGKSHTMEGYPDPPDLRGIIPSSFTHIFQSIESRNGNGSTAGGKKQFLVRASYLEIYQEEIRDLLSKDPDARLELKEHPDSGVYVKGLTDFVVSSVSEIETVLQAGKKHRVTGRTNMNERSSRSHAIFTITIETSEISPTDGKAHIRAGKLNMVDLAGSERQSKTGAEGVRLKEATKINLSLSALGNVISALVDGKSTHVPYRDSKLTRLLQDSLGGNTKTVMIANCGPADYNWDETMSTLRYAARAKQIKNKPKVNEDPKDAMLRQFQEEIERLKARLAEEEARSKNTAMTTVVVDGKEVQIPTAVQTKEVVIEKVIEKTVGVSEEELKALREKAEKERQELLSKAAEEQAALMQRATATEEERKKLEAEVAARAQEHARAEAEKDALAKQLTAMQEKLLIGGQVLDKAAKQEEELRLAQMELEERRRQEEALARELEEANLMIEEQYTSMAEEVEAKTRKLKKVWNKLQAAQAEARDLADEFSREREDMLSTIRELNRQLKLKQLILENFVPPHEVERVSNIHFVVATIISTAGPTLASFFPFFAYILLQIEARATWDDESDEWSLRGVELAGNRLRVRRPPSTTSPATDCLLSFAPSPNMADMRPKISPRLASVAAANALANAGAGGENPSAAAAAIARYKGDNVATLELEMPARTTEDFGNPLAMNSKIKISGQVRSVMRASGQGLQ
jgi:Kinesin motor domain